MSKAKAKVATYFSLWRGFLVEGGSRMKATKIKSHSKHILSAIMPSFIFIYFFLYFYSSFRQQQQQQQTSFITIFECFLKGKKEYIYCSVIFTLRNVYFMTHRHRNICILNRWVSIVLWYMYIYAYICYKCVIKFKKNKIRNSWCKRGRKNIELKWKLWVCFCVVCKEIIFLFFFYI